MWGNGVRVSNASESRTGLQARLEKHRGGGRTGLETRSTKESGEDGAGIAALRLPFGQPSAGNLRLATIPVCLREHPPERETSAPRTPETSNFKLQTSNFKLQTSNFKLQTSNFKLPPPPPAVVPPPVLDLFHEHNTPCRQPTQNHRDRLHPRPVGIDGRPCRGRHCRLQ